LARKEKKGEGRSCQIGVEHACQRKSSKQRKKRGRTKDHQRKKKSDKVGNSFSPRIVSLGKEAGRDRDTTGKGYVRKKTGGGVA